MNRTLATLAVMLALAGPVAAQTSSTSGTNSNMNQTSPSATTPNTTHPNNTPNNVSSPSNVSNPNATNNGSDMNNPNGSTNTHNMDANGRTSSSTLPRTASPLPLVAGAGVLSIATGLWLDRRRRQL